MKLQIFGVSFISAFMQLYVFLELVRPEFAMKKYYKKALVPAFFVASLIMGISPVFSIWQLNIVTMFGALYIILLLFDGNMIKKTIYVAIAYALFAMLETIVVSSLAVIGGMSLDYITGNISNWFIVAATIDILGLIIVKIINFLFKNNKHEVNNRYYIFVLMFPVLTALVCCKFLEISSNMTVAEYRRSFVLIVLLFIADAVLFYYVEHMMVLMKEKSEYALLKQKNDMEEKYYKKLEAVNQEQAVYRHDMKHYQETIKGLIQSEDIDGLKKISGDMETILNSAERIRYTSNGMLNALIWEKREYAEKKGIKLSMQIEPGIDISFVKDTDIISMVGNLIDNAVEAVQQCKNKTIEISMFEADGKFIMFQVNNHFDKGAIIKKNNTYITTKQNPMRHGLGIESVRKTAEIYGGILDIDIVEDVFMATLALAVGLHE